MSGDSYWSDVVDLFRRLGLVEMRHMMSWGRGLYPVTQLWHANISAYDETVIGKERDSSLVRAFVY